MMSNFDTTIDVTDRPDLADLMTFWRTLQSDPIRHGTFLDSLPNTLEDFLMPVCDKTMHLWIVHCQQQVAGASWFHDIEPCKEARSCLIASYYLPAYRSKLGRTALDKVHEAARRAGITHIIAGCRATNIAAYKKAIQVGYHHVGTIEEFGWFNGSLDPLHLFVLDPEDTDEAWRQGENRAAFNRGCRPHRVATVG